MSERYVITSTVQGREPVAKVLPEGTTRSEARSEALTAHIMGKGRGETVELRRTGK